MISCLALVTGCSSATDSGSNTAGATSTAGATNGGNASASGGGGASNVAGAVNGGSAAGGTSGSSQGGSSGANAQAGAPGGTNAGGAAGAAAAGAAGAGGAAGSGTAGAAGSNAGGSGGGSTGAFALTSPAWTAMQGCAPDMKSACPVFPKDNIGTNIGGSNKSPALDWTAGPSGTQSYALVFRDLSFMMQGKPFVHWVMWNIPGTTRMLPAGLETTAMPSVPQGSSQRSFNGNGFQGSGACGNVYEFVLYALTTPSFTPTGTTQTAVADGLAATNAPTVTLRARSGAPGCTE
jgi:phosphatidylethanolamine-binding protein (PEBP) family uncharacterized protein